MYLKYGDTIGYTPTAHISLVIKLVPGMANVVPRIRSSLKLLESSAKELYVDTKYSDRLGVNLKYSVIGYSGSDICKEPHIHTAGE